MDLTFTNNFHDTDVTVRLKSDGTLSDRQIKRVYRDLCGIPTCTCGGIRGRQWINDGVEVDMDYGLRPDTQLHAIFHHDDGRLERLSLS